MLPKLKCHKNANDIKTQVSQNLKFHHNTNVTKMYMSPKWKCHQNANVIKMEMSENTNVTKTQISQKLKSSGTTRYSGLVQIIQMDLQAMALLIPDLLL